MSAARDYGRGVAVAVVDSGVYADHPHVGGVAGGVAIDADGCLTDDYIDRIGHGTAVTAAIKEKAPAASYYAVRIFESRLSTRIRTLVAAIDWAIDARVQIVNLSLGTADSSHATALQASVDRARAAGVTIVSARDDDGITWFPGSLEGVVAVQVDWQCPRDEYRAVRLGNCTIFRASGFARPIPGVDPRRNLNGISFAVAHISGFLARALGDERAGLLDPVALLIAGAGEYSSVDPAERPA